MLDARPQVGMLDLSTSSSPWTSVNGRNACEMDALWKDGRLDSALLALSRMDQQGIVPSIEMYRSLLQACSKQKSLADTKQVHAHLAKHGLDSSRHLGNLVVTSLVNCGSLADGLQVFTRLTHRTVVSWTSIISGFIIAGQYQQALLCYDQMQQEGVQPDAYVFVSLVKACSRLEDLEQGKRIHSEIKAHGFESDVFVGSTLVSMYSKCGSIIDAQQVFDGLAQRNVVSWNALLAAYAQQDQGEKALQIYCRMEEEGVTPNDRTFVSALQACASLAGQKGTATVVDQNLKVQALQRGKVIHAKAKWRGLESDVFIGSTLVLMYAKCGSITDAKEVFDRFSQRDVALWNAMITAYVEGGQGESALKTFWEMQQEGVTPNARTFVSALQACGCLADTEETTVVDEQCVKVASLEKGRDIHAKTVERGLELDSFVGSTLVNMYGKCGSIKDARQLFDRLPKRNVVSWTAIISAYAQQDQGEKALEIYCQLLEEGLKPDGHAYVSALQACSKLAEKEESAFINGQYLKVDSLQRGREIHSAIIDDGFESNIFVGNALVSMYANCWSVKDAEQVFARLEQRDVVSWNIMIAAYAEHDQGEKAMQMYMQMPQEGVRPDLRTLVNALQASGKLADKEESAPLNGQHVKMECLQQVREIQATAVSMGLESDTSLSASLVYMYAKCGSIKDAEQVFQTSLQHDVVSWNALMAAYAQLGRGEAALQCYKQMQVEGIRPNMWTFVSAAQACGSIAETEEYSQVDGRNVKVEALQEGRAVHADATLRGFESQAFVGSTLISMYAKSGSIKDAEQVFNRMHQRDVVSWNSMIAAYAHQEQGEKSLQIFTQMQAEGVKADTATFISVLDACSRTGALDMCMHVHKSIVGRGFLCNLSLANSLVHAYGKCGSMVDAQHVFDSLSQPSLVSWSALIAGYSRVGDCVRSLQCFEDMLTAGFKPDGVAFMAVLSACSHAGMVENGLEYFESMTREHGISPTTEHYACVIDMVGRAGVFSKAENLLLHMPMQPDLPVWLCLLGACRKHGEVELGKRAFDAAVGLQPRHGAAYVLMSNIYADAGMWDCAQEVDELRHCIAANRQPGQSWIEHGQEVHTFMVGDHRHHQESSIYKLLTSLNTKLNQGGPLSPTGSIVQQTSEPEDSSRFTIRSIETLCQQGQVNKAVLALLRLDQQGCVPSMQIYQRLLQACMKRKALWEAKQISAQLAKHGLESNKSLGDLMVTTLATCGDLADAVQFFERLPHRTAFSWTAIISGYSNAGKCREALLCYDQMQQEGVQPDKYTFVSLLKACSKLGDLEEGKRIHADVLAHGFESDWYVRNTLVSMFAKCGSTLNAQQVFDGMSQHDVVTWNVMISAYAQQDQCEKALQMFRRMQEAGVMPTDRTFVSALQACGSAAEKEESTYVDGQCFKIESLQLGRKIHAGATEGGFEWDVFVGNTLVSMYSKCRSIKDAEHVFGKLQQRTVVSWNAMLAAYAQQGDGANAWRLYHQMQEQRVVPNARTFVSALQACGSLAGKEEIVVCDGKRVKVGCLMKGKEIHAAATGRGCLSTFVNITLVSLYAKCRSIKDAEQVFEKMQPRDVVAWNAMIAGYAEQDQGEDALHSFSQMEYESVSPDARTFVSVLQSCGGLAEKEETLLLDGQHVKAESLRKGRAIHASARVHGFESDIFVGNSLVSMYSKCGSIKDAEQVFATLSQRNVITWNSLIAGYAQQDQAEKALEIYQQMREEGVRPDARTFVSILQACGSLAEREAYAFVDGQNVKKECLEKGRELHAEAYRASALDVFVGSSLISLYAKCGSMQDAEQVFDNLAQRDVVAWNAMIAGYVQHEQGERALQLYATMQAESEKINEVTFVAVLRACSKTGALDICVQTHKKIVESGLERRPSVANSLLYAFSKVGSMEVARSIFDSMPHPDVVSWTALIAGYGQLGHCELSIESYDKMRLAGVSPNRVTYLALLSACCHAGMVDLGLEYFESMTSEHGIAPDVEHYTCVIDLVGRSGQFSKAEELLSHMPMKPDLPVWMCLLDACRKQRDVVRAKQFFDKAVALEPKHSAAYMLMANIYADAGMLECAQEVSDLRQSLGARKQPGKSWIEHEQKVHTFRVADQQHQEAPLLYALLADLSTKLKEAGYVAFEQSWHGELN